MARSGLPSGGGSSGLTRLVPLVDRYGPAIEYDLHHELNLDLLDFFRRVFSWAKLERLLDQLPSSSRFRCAMADDEEAAEEALDRLGDRVDRRTPPALVDVDFSASLLMVIADRLESLTAATVAANGGKYTPRPMLWPVSAIDRVKRRREQAEVASLNDEVYAAMARYEEMARPR